MGSDNNLYMDIQPLLRRLGLLIVPYERSIYEHFSLHVPVSYRLLPHRFPSYSISSSSFPLPFPSYISKTYYKLIPYSSPDLLFIPILHSHIHSRPSPLYHPKSSTHSKKPWGPCRPSSLVKGSNGSCACNSTNAGSRPFTTTTTLRTALRTAALIRWRRGRRVPLSAATVV